MCITIMRALCVWGFFWGGALGLNQEVVNCVASIDCCSGSFASIRVTCWSNPPSLLL